MTAQSPPPVDLPRIDDVDNSSVLWRGLVRGAVQLVEQYDAAVGHEKAAVRARMQQFRAVTLANLAAEVRVPVPPEKLERVTAAVKTADEIVAAALTGT